jgi:hypothetical protein
MDLWERITERVKSPANLIWLAVVAVTVLTAWMARWVVLALRMKGD